MATIYRQTIVPAEELYEGCLVSILGKLVRICEFVYKDMHVCARGDNHTWIRWGYRTLVPASLPVVARTRTAAIEKAKAETLAEARRAWS